MSTVKLITWTVSWNTLRGNTALVCYVRSYTYWFTIYLKPAFLPQSSSIRGDYLIVSSQLSGGKRAERESNWSKGTQRFESLWFSPTPFITPQLSWFICKHGFCKQNLGRPSLLGVCSLFFFWWGGGSWIPHQAPLLDAHYPEFFGIPNCSPLQVETWFGDFLHPSKAPWVVLAEKRAWKNTLGPR